MGHSKADKAESHERIVKIAAAKFREAGLDGIGVADLMKEAGLTHGGFYRHFESRDELVAEAVESALAEGARRLGRVVEKSGDHAFAAVVDAYLNKEHVDRRGSGCALVALANDVVRAGSRTRAAYTRQVESYLGLFAELLQPLGPDARRRAITVLSALVGALALARAVGDEALTHEVLESVAAEIKALGPVSAAQPDNAAAR
jgi:TetR/AcrR family transcriptional regulator, transcriptional repressor for nem operon